MQSDRMNDLFYKHLKLIRKDEHQLAAYNSNSNTVIIAGPGSGKTRVLTLKAMQLMQESINGNAGLACLSYSRETVREIKKRLSQYGYSQRRQDYIGTVHGFCLAEIISPFSHLYPSYNIPKPLKIASNKLTDEIYSSVLKELGKDERQITKIGIAKERLLSIVGESSVNTETDPLYSDAALLFERKLQNTGYIDFTQMTKVATLLIQEKEYVRKSLEARFPYLLIDEYQDLGKALHEMVLSLHGNTEIVICAVGDMDQSIYGFQGAYPDFLKELYDRDDFNSYQLKNNYRSNKHIIQASITTLDPPPPHPEYNSMIRSSDQPDFTFIKCKAEMEAQYNCVADKVIPKLTTQGIPYNEIAIITGSNNEATAMATILLDRGIPAYVARWSFDTRTDIVQWLMECARWCNDPENNSFDSLFKYWEYLLHIHNDLRVHWEYNQRQIQFQEVLEQSKERQQLLPWLNWLIGQLQIGDVLQNSERFPDERENLLQLIEEAKTGKLINHPYLKLAKLTEPENEITVITRHSVKGLEFEAVIMLGMEEGRFPWYSHNIGSKEYAEDKRIAYVCVSRAKMSCIMLYSENYTRQTKYGVKTFSQKPSVFWMQLRKQFGNEHNLFSEDNYN